ncbi:hypothetical protein PVAP13_6NG001700 [Panicum virgatum]|uniref:Uncharacterized protein n=1 Tax=Panicum virgatum TaxID=38727 RepID=A0A8T0R721_PANVG|nr:hypothetical protein PVAP13_6NG001700 [Panicum virgatum]
MSPGLALQKVMNSLKSMQPSPSVSISAIMRCTSSAEVDPSVRSASVSSDSEILPSPLVSNRLKIRSMSAASAIVAVDRMVSPLLSICTVPIDPSLQIDTVKAAGTQVLTVLDHCARLCPRVSAFPRLVLPAI